MSAPLVVNTKDGMCWTRRTVTSSGIALYAPEGVCGCPEFVMATEAELAEHGIVGSADVLPVPVGTEPLALSEAQVEALAAAGNRVVNDAVHEDLCMCDAWPEKCLSSGNFRMGDWDMSGLEAALPAVLALWEQMRGGELERLRTRVAELEAERHTTNEALDDAVQALRARNEAEGAEVFVPRTERSRWVDIAATLNAAHDAGMPVGIDLDGTLTDHRMWSVVWDRDAERWTVAGYEGAEDPCRPCGCPKRFDRHADGCPTLRDEDPFLLRHAYRVGRDLPETGGAR